jgi:alkylation response protein AidB-like acyl-CoA dehydrogenase
MAAAALAEFGSGEQVELWLIPVVRGERVLTAALPDTGSPSGFTAERAGDAWLVSGAQSAMLFGAFADGFLVPALTPDGIAMFLVDRDQDGVSVSAQQATDHADTGLLELSEAGVSALLGEPGGRVDEWLRLRGTVGLRAQQLGVCSARWN